MPAQKGRSLLVYVQINGTYQKIEGQRTGNFTLNNSPVDVSTKDTNNWRELLENGGLSTIGISVDGVDQNAPYLEQLRQDSVVNNHNMYQIVMPNGAYFQVRMMIASLQQQGNYDGALTYNLSLESSGQPTYVPAAS